jgi:hypothetical protein
VELASLEQEVAGAAANFEDALSGGEVGLGDQVAVDLPDAKKAREDVVDGKEPIPSSGWQIGLLARVLDCMHGEFSKIC